MFLGITPDGIVGHSVGEIGCAYADGSFTAKEVILAAYWRGKVHENTITCRKYVNVNKRIMSTIVFSHDVTAAILVSQTNPVGVELFSYVKLSFVPINLHGCWPRE